MRAVEAGADLLLMPHNAKDTVRALVKAVRDGRISRSRLDASVTRILTAKVKLGLSRGREVNLSRVETALASPESAARAEAVAERAITLVKNGGGLIPLAAPESACLTVLPESNNGSEGPHLMDEFRKRQSTMKMQLLDPAAVDQASLSLAGCTVNLLAVYSTKAVYSDGAPLPGDFPGCCGTPWPAKLLLS